MVFKSNAVVSDGPHIIGRPDRKETMSKVSTALLTVGPRSISPWGDRAWRVSLTAQLVEGGSSAHWLVTPTEPAEYRLSSSSLVVPAPENDEVVDSVLMLLASHLGDSAVEGYLVDTHNLEVLDGVRSLATFWDVSPSETTRFIVEKLSNRVRLGFTVLDDSSLVTGGVIETLRGYGFDVDVFHLLSSSKIAAG